MSKIKFRKWNKISEEFKIDKDSKLLDGCVFEEIGDEFIDSLSKFMIRIALAKNEAIERRILANRILISDTLFECPELSIGFEFNDHKELLNIPRAIYGMEVKVSKLPLNTDFMIYQDKDLADKLRNLDELEMIKDCTIPNLIGLIKRLYNKEELGEYQEILDMILQKEDDEND